MEKIGKLLKEKRLALGMTVEDVSVKTRLTQKHIKALEEGNMAFFHDDLSYLRFFVKSYCEAVGVDFEDIKDELRESVQDYTQTISMNVLKNHQEMEKNISNSDLSKVDGHKKDSMRVKKRRSIMSKSRFKHVDFSLVSLIAIVGVVAIVIALAVVIFVKTGNNNAASQKNEQPVAPVEQNVAKPKDKKKTKEVANDVSITKTGITQYTIDNAKEGTNLKFEVYFGGSNTGFSMTVDGQVLHNPPAKIYDYQSTVNATVKAKKDRKIQIYIGWMKDVSIKINGQIVKIDDSIASSNSQQTLEFTITGDTNESTK